MNLPGPLESCLRAGAGTGAIAVFDCDGTLIRGDIGESMFYHQIEHFLFRESPAALWTDYPRKEELGSLFDSLVQHPPSIGHRDQRHIDLADHLLSWYFSQLKMMKTEKACSDIVRLFSGFRPSEMREIAAETISEEHSASVGNRPIGSHHVPRGMRFIKETGELLEQVRASGFSPWIVSGSNMWTVKHIAGLVGVPEENVLGIDLELSGGIYSSIVKTPVPVRKGKVDLLKALGLPAPSIVVSDSTYDIPLFEYSTGPKVLVRSNDQSNRFFEHANVTPDEQWVIIEAPSYLPPNRYD